MIDVATSPPEVGELLCRSGQARYLARWLAGPPDEALRRVLAQAGLCFYDRVARAGLTWLGVEDLRGPARA